MRSKNGRLKYNIELPKLIFWKMLSKALFAASGTLPVIFLSYFLMLLCIPAVFGKEAGIHFLRNFDHISELKAHPTSHLGYVKQHQQIYLKEIKNRWVYPMIQNLNDYLTQLLPPNKNCFTVIDNFQNANLNSFANPVILRRPEPVVITFKSEQYNFYNVIFGVASTNITGKFSMIIQCTLSEYLVGLVENSDTCLRINLTKFTLNSKPFNCQVHLGIYPMTITTHQTTARWLYPKIFFVAFKHVRSYIATPSIVPSLNIITQLVNSTMSAFNQCARKKWMYWSHTIYTSPSTYHHNIFILLHVKASSRQETNGNIVVIEILKYCPTCSSLNGPEDNKVVGTPLMRANWKTITRLGFVSPSERLIWVIVDPSSNNVLAKMLRHVKTCLETPCHMSFFNVSSAQSPLDAVGIAHAHVFKSIMNNFTQDAANYSHGANANCLIQMCHQYLVMVGEHTYIREFLIFHHYPRNQLTSLRLVGCGKQGFTGIQFQELANAYDCATWACIGLSTLLLSITIQISAEEESIDKFIIATWKVLLEQGNPFPPCVAKRHRTAGIIGMFLLVGIILSSAYKNRNVYKMLTPRLPIPYKYLSELVRDGFSVYTRGEYIAIRPLTVPELRYNKLNISIGSTMILLKSEVNSILDNYEGDFLTSGSPKVDKALVNSGLTNVAKVHPDATKAFSRLLQKALENTTEVDLWWGISNEIIHEWFQQLKKIERFFYMEAFENHEKTAIALPSYVASEFQKTLVENKKILDVFVGVETFTDMDSLFYLSGPVPPFLVQRIHRIGESGVWEWIVKLLGGKYLQGANDIAVTPASIKGNIVVIFAAFFCGICLACTCFIMEVLKHIKFCPSCWELEIFKC